MYSMDNYTSHTWYIDYLDEGIVSTNIIVHTHTHTHAHTHTHNLTNSMFKKNSFVHLASWFFPA
jgi:hypothetical protein